MLVTRMFKPAAISAVVLVRMILVLGLLHYHLLRQIVLNLILTRKHLFLWMMTIWRLIAHLENQFPLVQITKLPSLFGGEK